MDEIADDSVYENSAKKYLELYEKIVKV